MNSSTSALAAPGPQSRRNNVVEAYQPEITPISRRGRRAAHRSLLRTGRTDSVAVAVRYLLARYDLDAVYERPQTIAVTSAISGEGVTTVSMVLAEVLGADLQATVCWVDFSGFAAGPPTAEDPQGVVGEGLMEVLQGDSAIGDVLKRAGESEVWLLGAGSVRNAGTNMAARSQAMAGVIAELRRRFDYIVFDSGPILVDSDALALMRFADAYVLVARQDGATKSQVVAAAAELKPVLALGAILNDRSTRTPKFIRKIMSN